MDEEAGETNERTLLQRQDAGAFTKLVHEHEETVAGLARSLGLAGADLEDATAEAFAEVYRSLPRFEGRSSVRTWVYQIATRTIWRVRESKQKRALAGLTDDVVDRSQASPADEAADAQERERIWAAVAMLEHRQATAVELYYGRDCSVDEIADVLACPPGTVKTLLFRARAALRETLGRWEEKR